MRRSRSTLIVLLLVLRFDGAQGLRVSFCRERVIWTDDDDSRPYYLDQFLLIRSIRRHAQCVIRMWWIERVEQFAYHKRQLINTPDTACPHAEQWKGRLEVWRPSGSWLFLLSARHSRVNKYESGLCMVMHCTIHLSAGETVTRATNLLGDWAFWALLGWQSCWLANAACLQFPEYRTPGSRKVLRQARRRSCTPHDSWFCPCATLVRLTE